jgi:RsiW-degrading membrane proteinase PrsW (M82 family)
MGPALRRREICIAISAVLIAVLTFAAAVHLLLLASMRADVVSVFFRALVLSGMLSLLPLSLLWLLERRERQTPWLFAAAFLWGGCIATALALPFNSAFLTFADTWVVQHPVVREVLGPDAAMLLAAPISAPIVEEIAKAVGVLAIFRLLRPEFHNVRDGIVYGALVGVGFNWFEAALYLAQGYAETGAPPYGLQLGSRYALLGLGGHAMSTGIFGAFLGIAMQTRRGSIRILAPIAGLVLAIAAHMVNNALPLLAALAAVAAGEPAPVSDALDLGFVQAFVGSSLLELAIFLPFLLLSAGAVAKQRARTASDPRGARRRGRGRGERGRVRGDRRRPRAAHASHRPAAAARLRRAGERAARARVPQAPGAARRPRPRPRRPRGGMAGRDLAPAGGGVVAAHSGAFVLSLQRLSPTSKAAGQNRTLPYLVLSFGRPATTCRRRSSPAPTR